MSAIESGANFIVASTRGGGTYGTGGVTTGVGPVGSPRHAKTLMAKRQVIPMVRVRDWLGMTAMSE
jgi:hypothetical protein